MFPPALRSAPVRHLARTMASAAPLLHKFLVYAPDNTDADTLQKRLLVRGEHLATATPRINSGILSASIVPTCTSTADTRILMSAKRRRRRPEVAGAMLTPESIESPAAERKMIGSLLILEAKDMEEVRAMVENDIYYTSGVVSFTHPSSALLLDAEARIVGYRETRHIAFPACRAAPLTDMIPLDWFRGGLSLQRSLKDAPNTR